MQIFKIAWGALPPSATHAKGTKWKLTLAANAKVAASNVTTPTQWDTKYGYFD